MALYEDSLYALAHLLQRVSAPRWEEHIRSDIEAWQKHRDARQHSRKYAGHSTYSDWAIHSQNGHRVNEIQQVWANKLLWKLQVNLRLLSERPDDPRQETRILNSLSAQRSVLKAQGRGVDADADLRVICCNECGKPCTSHLSVERVIAGDLLPGLLLEAYESGTMIELVDSVLDGTLENLSEFRARVTAAAERAGIAVAAMSSRQPDACAACGSDDVNVRQWAIAGNGQLYFELAEFERGQGSTGSVRSVLALRLWGIAIAILVFFVLVAEFRYLVRHGPPDATGSVRGNWGLMALLGLPLVVLVGAALQVMSGMHIRDYFSAFARESTPKKILVSTIAVAVAIAAVLLAARLG